MKKGQSAIEFVILFSFMILIFAGFFVAIQAKIIDATERKDESYLAEINDLLISEFSLAERTKTDYHRYFSLPTSIQGNTYDVMLVDRYELVVTAGDKEYVDFLNTEVLGSLKIGRNEIHHVDGVMNVNGELINDSKYSGLFLNFNAELCYIYENTLVDIYGSTSDINLCQHYDDLGVKQDFLKECRDWMEVCYTTQHPS